jgi:hypothetical protein
VCCKSAASDRDGERDDDQDACDCECDPHAGGHGLGTRNGPEEFRKSAASAPGQMRAIGSMTASGAGAVTISPVVNVSMPAGGKPEDGSRFGAEISRAIVSAVQSELVNQRRQGGLLRR